MRLDSRVPRLQTYPRARVPGYSRRLERWALASHQCGAGFRPKARQSVFEVETGSRQENASNQESRTWFRYNRNGI